MPASRKLCGELADDDDRGHLAHSFAVANRPEPVVEDKPGSLLVLAERHEVGSRTGCRLGCEHGRHGAIPGACCGGTLELVGEGHRARSMRGKVAPVDRTAEAKELFAPLGPTYERYAALLSYGQDPRWRSYLVSRIGARPGDRVLDVATGTGAVARELAAGGCAVVGLDQSPEMLAEARRRGNDANKLVEGRAESLPFADGEFDALTFTYLFRYVDDPATTLRELARVVRPGGTVAGLEFGLPRGLWRGLWEIHVRAVLPAAGLAIGGGWRQAGSFLGPSIRAYWKRWPLDRQLRAWGDAGLTEVAAQHLSVGGGVVTWGRKKA